MPAPNNMVSFYIEPALLASAKVAAAALNKSPTNKMVLDAALQQVVNASGSALTLPNYGFLYGRCGMVAHFFPPRNTLTGFLFDPSAIVVIPTPTASLVYQVAFMLVRQLTGDMMEHLAITNNRVKLAQTLNGITYPRLVLRANAHTAAGKFALGLLYRMIELPAMALRHKIVQSHSSRPTKLILSILTRSLPLLVLVVLGEAGKIALAFTLVREMVPLLLRPAYRNMLTQLDLIVKTRRFGFANFIQQNAITLALWLAAKWAVYLLQPLHAGVSEAVFIATECDGQLFNGITPITYSSLAFGLFAAVETLAKIIIDSVCILLYCVGVVKDLRDPINSLLPVKKRPRPTRPLDAAVDEEQAMTELAPQAGGEKPRRAVGGVAAIHATDLKMRRIPRGKSVVSQPAIAEGSAGGSVPSTHPQRLGSIPIPGEDCALYMLYGPGTWGLANVWGILTYRPDKRRTRINLAPHITSLSTGHVGTKHNSSSAIKAVDHGVFKIRPAAEKNRAVGLLVEARAEKEVREQAIYNLLRYHFGYEQALALVEQMKAYDPDGEINLINFSVLCDRKDVDKPATQRALEEANRN